MFRGRGTSSLVNDGDSWACYGACKAYKYEGDY